MATLKINNKTNCDFLVYGGLNVDSNYIGEINVLETKEFIIDLEDESKVKDVDFYLLDRCCSDLWSKKVTYQITLESGDVSLLDIE